MTRRSELTYKLLNRLPSKMETDFLRPCTDRLVKILNAGVIFLSKGRDYEQKKIS